MNRMMTATTALAAAASMIASTAFGAEAATGQQTTTATSKHQQATAGQEYAPQSRERTWSGSGQTGQDRGRADQGANDSWGGHWRDRADIYNQRGDRYGQRGRDGYNNEGYANRAYDRDREGRYGRGYNDEGYANRGYDRYQEGRYGRGERGYAYGDHRYWDEAGWRPEWRRGERMSWRAWREGHRVSWRRHHLARPPFGYEWREVDGRYVLAAVATGLIASIIAANP